MNIQPSSGEINAAELVSVMELKTPVVLPRTSLIQKWRVIMKKYRISIFAGLWFNFIGWATETVNIHDRVNNAQAPAHQMQSAAAPVGIQGLLLV